MRNAFVAFGLIAGMLGSTGCFARLAVTSNAKETYVARQTLFGSAMYHCVVGEGNRPVCTRLDEN
jgi:hypothetical protein